MLLFGSNGQNNCQEKDSPGLQRRRASREAELGTGLVRKPQIQLSGEPVL